MLTDAAPELAQLVIDADELAKQLGYAIPPEGYSGVANSVVSLLERNKQADIDFQLLAAVEGLINALDGTLEFAFDFSCNNYSLELNTDDIRQFYMWDECERDLMHVRLKSISAARSRRQL